MRLRSAITLPLWLVAACGVSNAAGDPDAPPAGLSPSHALLADVLRGSRRAHIMDGAARPAARAEHWSITVGGLDGTRDIVRRGKDFREDTVLGPFASARGAYRGTEWRQNENGLTVLLGGVHQRDEISRNALSNATAGARDVLLAGEVTEPTPAYVVEVKPPSGRHEYLFFDKQTYLLTRREAAAADVRVVTTYDDFRTTGGATEPWHIHSSDGRPFNDEDEKLVSISLDAPVDEHHLEVPQDRRRLVETSASSVMVPVKVVADRVVVPVKIAGRTVNLQLDSGASGIVVDRSVLEALHIKTYGRNTGATAGEYVATRAILPELSIGPVHMRDVVVDSIPFAQSTGDGAPLAGLLGFDFIDGAVVHIDYLHGSLELIEGSSFVPPADAKSLTLLLDDGVPFVSVKIGSAGGDHFIMDTGADRSMLASTFTSRYPREVADQGLGQALTASFPFLGRISGVGGLVSVRPTQVRSLGIAGITLPNWLFMVSENAKSFEGEDMDGLIGQDFLRNFDVYLDYRRARIYLRPNDRFRARWPSQTG